MRERERENELEVGGIGKAKRTKWISLKLRGLG